MGTPTKRRTSGQRKRRAIHLRLTSKILQNCPKCKKEILPHRACGFCGYYKGREVITTAKKSVKTKRPASA